MELVNPDEVEEAPQVPLLDPTNDFRRTLRDLPPPPAISEEEKRGAQGGGIGQGYPDGRKRELLDWAYQARALGMGLMKIGTRLNVSGMTLQRWIEASPAEQERWLEANKAFRSALQDEAHRRGAHGYEYQPGKIKYSDRLLEIALKAELPEIYDPYRGTSGGRVVINVQQVEQAEIVEGEADEIIAELEAGDG